MSRNPSLPSTTAPALPGAIEGLPAEAGRAPLPLEKLHRLLRGRYAWAIVVGLTGALLGATAGWLSTQPTYRSLGQVRIRPMVPRVIYPSEDRGATPLFDQYVDFQASLLKSRRVIDLAMSNRDWLAIAPDRSPKAIAEFIDSLEVKRPERAEMVEVAYADPDPVAAQTAVRAVIEAYLRIFHELEAESQTDRMPLLLARRTELQQKLDQMREQVLAIAKEYGPEGLAKMRDFKLDELTKMEARIRDLHVQIATNQARDSVLTAPATSGSLPPEALAQHDDLMRDYLQRRALLQDELGALRQRFGDNHREVRLAQGRLDALTQAIGHHVQRLRQDLAVGRPVAVVAANNANPLSGLSTQELQAQEEKLREIYHALEGEAARLGRENLDIEKLKLDMTTLQQRLEETKTRIDELRIESEVRGRIEVISAGDAPVRPYRDGRKVRAAAGFFGGGSLGMGLVALLGLLSPRLRLTADARDALGRVRLLGVLPTLEEGAEGATPTEAAYCVHQIRTMLQLGGAAPGHRVFAVTGAAPGSGKTSLALALGMSFAATGSRTLLVDGDFEGHGLTARLGVTARRRLGEILLERGWISAGQLDEALRHGAAEGRPVGEVLAGQGAVTTAQVEEALREQEQTGLGLRQALGGRPWAACVAETGVPHLTILPVARGPAEDAGRQVAPAEVKKLLAELRAHYDTVLIDTGPIPGSVEGAILTAEADQTVLIVSRGDERAAVEDALALLEQVGAKLAGVVFNRAQARDFGRSVSGRSVRARSGGRGQPAGGHYGPVGNAVMQRRS